MNTEQLTNQSWTVYLVKSNFGWISEKGVSDDIRKARVYSCLDDISIHHLYHPCYKDIRTFIYH